MGWKCESEGPRIVARVKATLPETKITPEIRQLEDVISSWEDLFSGANC